MNLVGIHTARTIREGHNRTRWRISQTAHFSRMNNIARRRNINRMHIQPEQTRHLLQLNNNVTPLAKTQVVQELCPTHATERRTR